MKRGAGSLLPASVSHMYTLTCRWDLYLSPSPDSFLQIHFSRFISPDSFLQGKARVHMYTLTRVTLPSRSMFGSRSSFCTYLYICARLRDTHFLPANLPEHANDMQMISRMQEHKVEQGRECLFGMKSSKSSRGRACESVRMCRLPRQRSTPHAPGI